MTAGRLKIVVRLTLLGLSAPAIGYARASDYTAQRLKLPPVWVFYDTRSLSQDGRAAGYVRINNSTDLPSVWEADGTYHSLVVGDPHQQSDARFAADGRIVGFVYFGSVATPGYWSDGAFVSLPHHGLGGAVWGGSDDYLVGDTGEPDPIGGGYMARVTVWDASGTAHRVGGLDGARRFARAVAVSSTGLYVGHTWDGASSPIRPQGFVGQGLNARILVYPDMEVRNASDVNAEGWVVGGWTPDGATDRGFVGRASGTDARDLGMLTGYPELFPKGINDGGEIVGAASLGVTFDVALYWPPGVTEPIDLNTLVSIPGEPRLVEAMDINNAGQILARGFNGYYILTPVPEPSAFALVGLGVIACATRRTRRSE
jgi:hypothetical protein